MYLEIFDNLVKNISHIIACVLQQIIIFEKLQLTLQKLYLKYKVLQRFPSFLNYSS